MNLNQTIKIGARSLTETQATILLPTYPKIKHQIELFRNEAKKFNKYILHNNIKSDFEKYEEYTNFDNIISILGDRGSGKTSVFFTLKNNHVKNKTDITLPLIVPDNMGEISDTLGWIISFLNDFVEEFEPKLKKHRAENQMNIGYDCMEEGDSKLKIKFKNLRKAYEIRKKMYLNKVLERDEGTGEYIQDKAKITQADHDLIMEFKKFINELIEAKKKLMELDFEKEPLILIFFDDVDISADRCPEVLETIRNYLTHPNIVVFVSGDYKVYSEIICLDFLKREKVNNRDYETVFIPSNQVRDEHNNYTNSALELRIVRSQEYLKKVLPPSFRYEMAKMTEQNKKDFFYEINSINNDKNPTLSQLINKINFNGKSFVEEFFYSEKVKELPVAFFKIFDNNPRGLINPYYYLFQKIYFDINQQWDIRDLKHFLQILINSSEVLQKNKQLIESIIILNETNTIQNNYSNKIQVDFELLTDKFLIQVENDQVNSIVIDEFITLYILFYFYEKLLEFTIDDFYNNHSSSTSLYQILNYKQEIVFPKINDSSFLINLYSILNERLSITKINLFGIKEKPSKRLEQIYFETLSDFQVSDQKIHRTNKNLNLIKLFETIFYQDEEWVKHKLEFIKENGKFYDDIHKGVVSSIKSQELNIFSIEEIDGIFDKYKIYLKGKTGLETSLDDFMASYLDQDIEQISKKDIDGLIEHGIKLEQLVKENSTLNDTLIQLNENISMLNDEIEITEEELKNINDKDLLIKTRRLMSERIKDLERFIKNDLREKEWNSIKDNFIIATEISEDQWITIDNEMIKKKPIETFNPLESLEKYKIFSRDNLKSTKKIGLFLKENDYIVREEILSFARRYFKESQEQQRLRNHLPLDIEGRTTRIQELKKNVLSLQLDLGKSYKILEKNASIIDEIHNNFKIDFEDWSHIDMVMSERYNTYLVGSINMRVRSVINRNNFKYELDLLDEILKIYREGINESLNLVRSSIPLLRLGEEEKHLLKSLRTLRTSSKIDLLISRILNQGSTINPRLFQALVEELIDYNRLGRIPKITEEIINENIKVFSNFTDNNRTDNNSKKYTVTKNIVLEFLGEIIIPYTKLRVHIENIKVESEPSSYYFRELKESLINYVHEQNELRRQSRFIYFIEQVLIQNQGVL